jgi:hypothetical protein
MSKMTKVCAATTSTVATATMRTGRGPATRIGPTYDETEGLSFFAGVGEFERAFTEPTLLDQRLYRQRVVDYLDDDSVSPLPFRRMADRDPLRASEMFRRVLRRKSFDWQRDGEQLMRQRKRSYFDRAPLPRNLPINSRLAHYAGSQ